MNVEWSAEATAIFLAGVAATLAALRMLHAAKRRGWSWPPSSRRWRRLSPAELTGLATSLPRDIPRRKVDLAIQDIREFYPTLPSIKSVDFVRTVDEVARSRELSPDAEAQLRAELLDLLAWNVAGVRL